MVFTWTEHLVAAGMPAPFLQSLGRKGVLDPKLLDTTLYVAVMKNRYGWSEKQNDPHVTGVDAGNLSDDDLNRMVKDLMAKWEQARGKTVV